VEAFPIPLLLLLHIQVVLMVALAFSRQLQAHLFIMQAAAVVDVIL
jgi:hypothetical protein